MAECDKYYLCHYDNDEFKIKSLIINDAVVPAITICNLENGKLINDSKCAPSLSEITTLTDFWAYFGKASLDFGGEASSGYLLHYSTNGLVSISGIATIHYIPPFAGAGSITLSGEAGSNYLINYAVVGSMSFAGTASITELLSYISVGGISLAGVAIPNIILGHIGSGDLLFSGIGVPVSLFEYPGVGGIALSGLGTLSYGAGFLGEGGINFGGLSNSGIIIPYSALGGLTFAGLGIPNIILNHIGSGGFDLYGGEFALDLTEIFSGTGTPPLPDYVQASDPHVVKIGTQWHMFYVSVDLGDGKLHTHVATLPDNDPLAISGWTVDTDFPVIVPSSDTGDWDYTATETPCYVYGYDHTAEEWVERIYYTGWRDASLNVGNKGNYSIGFVQRDGGNWVKSASNPVLSLTDTAIFGQLGGDQTVLYSADDETWYMFYQEITNDGYIITLRALSVDGIVWTDKEQVGFGPPSAPVNLPNGPYHIDCALIDGKYYFTGWISRSPLSQQGLWCTISSSLDEGGSGDFYYWLPLLYEKTSGDAWYVVNDGTKQANHEIGLFGSCLAKDGDNLFMFFHVVIFNGSNNIASIGGCNMNKKLLDFNLTV